MASSRTSVVSRPSRLVAFDLDGVLYSSEPFIADVYRDAIAAVNQQRPGSFSRLPSTREILDHVGWPVPVILERLFPAVEPEAVRLLYAVTLDVITGYVERKAGLLYTGTTQTLTQLSTSGYRLAVASNGRARYINSVLSTYSIDGFFVPLLTGEQVGDKAAVLRSYVERYASSPADAVMVGDRSSDVDAARAVGCHFIGCDYGHGYRSEIEEAGPVVGSLTALPPVINRLFGTAGH